MERSDFISGYVKMDMFVKARQLRLKRQWKWDCLRLLYELLKEVTGYHLKQRQQKLQAKDKFIL